MFDGGSIGLNGVEHDHLLLLLERLIRGKSDSKSIGLSRAQALWESLEDLRKRVLEELMVIPQLVELGVFGQLSKASKRQSFCRKPDISAFHWLNGTGQVLGQQGNRPAAGLGDLMERDPQGVKVPRVGIRLSVPNMLIEASEKHSIGKCHNIALGYTLNPFSDVVCKVELFFNGSFDERESDMVLIFEMDREVIVGGERSFNNKGDVGGF
ncbi:hypothetical protein Tco_0692059 [Tanacetum coccineum]